jgi:hypothetical protein
MRRETRKGTHLAKQFGFALYNPGLSKARKPIGQLSLDNGQPMGKRRMSRRCPVYAPYMSRIFKEAGHLRDNYGANTKDHLFW